jgi:acyl-CoA reductase-like NAD-dependent aldehyde dehydrogenase
MAALNWFKHDSNSPLISIANKLVMESGENVSSGLFINGQWRESSESLTVCDKFNRTEVGRVAVAGPREIEMALASAQRGASVMAKLPSHRRALILSETSKALINNRESIARLIAKESGKPIRMARIEVDRGASTFQYAAEEAKRVHGETIPLDASPNGEGYFGFWQRRPIGVVGAITPFNFPLNLVAHKVAPAIASGNAFVLKPAEQTPLTAVRLFEILLEAGLPAEAGQLLQGQGEIVGDAIVVNSPVIIAADADLDWAAKRCAMGAFGHAGQVCISVQRIFVESVIESAFCERLVAATHDMVVGDPMNENTDVGPMISEDESVRIESWVEEAKQQGANNLTGGQRHGAIYLPTLLENTQPEMKVMNREVFAPLASLVRCASFPEALVQAGATPFGLQASVFTTNIHQTLQAIKQLNFGGVIINEMPGFRVDHMPYGGNRQSGIGREGVRFAIEEMTNIQTVVIYSPE